MPEADLDRPKRPRSRRRVILISVGAVLLVALAVVGWIGIRAVLAREQLEATVPLVSELRAQILERPSSDTEVLASRIGAHAAEAAALTSDPIWRAVEFVPFAGPNLTAVRETAEAVDILANGALPSLVDGAGVLSPESFALVDGRIDVTAIATAAPFVERGDDAIQHALAIVDGIETGATLPLIAGAVAEFQGLLHESADVVSGLRVAVDVLPSMLGADGPRSYLLMSQNNAELRSLGGLPGALALVSVDDGRLSISTTTSATEIGGFAQPYGELTPDELEIFGVRPARTPHNITMLPEFPRAATLARDMWRAHTGSEIDGVVSLDPVALGYLLESAGGVTVDGQVLDGATAGAFLLNGVYLTLATNQQQDAFFSVATGVILDSFLGGSYDKSALIDALARAASESRISVWSAHEDEQEAIAGSGVDGDRLAREPFGVFFNDSTGSKIDFYLRASVDAAVSECGSDPSRVGLRIRLASEVQDPSVMTLPPYVTGDGSFGVAPYDIGTNVHVFAPKDATLVAFRVDGVDTPFDYTFYEGRPVVSIQSLLGPGATDEIELVFAVDPSSTDPLSLDALSVERVLDLVHTPMSSEVPVREADLALCDAG